jgi:CO/xanthine dehydrogenase FAD-binding subunit
MIMPFAYVKPDTVDAAIEALQEDNAHALAGGTALLVDLRNGVVNSDLVVDLKGIEELDTFKVDAEKGVSIGARTDLNAILEDKTLKTTHPVIHEAVSVLGTYQLRNRATLVGNICKASPAADMGPPLFVLGAEIVIKGPEGERTMPVTEFMTGVQENALEKGEIVVRVDIPAYQKAKMGYMKKQRIKGHDLAVVNVAGLADPGSGTLRICVGACAETPLLLEGMDQLYKEVNDIDKLAEEVSELAVSSISPIDDVRATAEYRSDMARVYVKRIVKRICS